MPSSNRTGRCCRVERGVLDARRNRAAGRILFHRTTSCNRAEHSWQPQAWPCGSSWWTPTRNRPIRPPIRRHAATPAASKPGCRDFARKPSVSGISRATVASVLDDMTMDPGVIARDRKQGFFAQSFLAFSDKLISQNRIQNGIARLKQHRDLFAKVEKQYGVPGPVITAFWALESDYGSVDRQAAHPARARDAGLRLPAPGHVPHRTHGCAAHHRPWRSDGRGDDRRRGPENSARPSSYRRTTSSTRSTMTATAGAT